MRLLLIRKKSLHWIIHASSSTYFHISTSTMEIPDVSKLTFSITLEHVPIDLRSHVWTLTGAAALCLLHGPWGVNCTLAKQRWRFPFVLRPHIFSCNLGFLHLRTASAIFTQEKMKNCNWGLRIKWKILGA